MDTQQNHPLAGVIFDMDGVLCDSEPFICEAACRMFHERYGREVLPEDFVPFVGAGENRYLGGVAQKYGVELDIDADKARTYAIYLEIIQGRLTPLPGVGEFIRRCRGAGLKLAVATAADRVKLDGNLRQLALEPALFDALVTGSDVTHKKPHPEAFLKAAEMLALPADRCLVVEDAPNGVRAAKAAGALCLGLTSSFSPEILLEAGADFIAADLAGTGEEVYARFPGPEGTHHGGGGSV